MPTPETSTTPIVCPLFPWYSRLNHRFAGLGALFLVFGLWFFVDGQWRWPAENAQVGQREAFIKEVEAAKAAGSLEAWIEQAKTKGLPVPASLDRTASNVADVLWAVTAAKQNWPEKPKLHTGEELAQQIHLALFMFAALIVLAIYLVLIRNRKLVGNADHLVLPNGSRVTYSDVFRIDKRKWDRQGLAYLFYRDGSSEKKAAIDDLQYDGAGKVLDQLLAVFHGELIEKIPEGDGTTDAREGKSDSAS